MSGFQECVGFAIVPVPGGYRLSDLGRDGAWGAVGKRLFRTEEHARDYAYACDNFKCGRSMSIRDTPTGF
jgi:hypothetical protein